MSGELVVVIVLLGAAIAMFAMGRPRMDVVAVNTLVVEPGRYRFGDFVRVGAPFAVVVLLVSVVLVPLLLPF